VAARASGSRELIADGENGYTYDPDDVGGLATAVREVAHAGGHGIRVELDAVPVLPQTERVCALLGADPLGLIASGSLLVCCDPGETAALVDTLAAAGVAATPVGEVGAPGAGVSAWRRDEEVAWPAFATDEVARLLSES
jgi:hydrogenase maturation factor